MGRKEERIRTNEGKRQTKVVMMAKEQCREGTLDRQEEKACSVS